MSESDSTTPSTATTAEPPTAVPAATPAAPSSSESATSAPAPAQTPTTTTTTTTTDTAAASSTPADGDGDGDGSGSGDAGAVEPPPVPSAGPGPAGGDTSPTVCIVIGMAGSGKTTLMQRINAEAHMRGNPAYVVNLDPAVSYVPYEPAIDIRDTVKYKEVMKQFKLGPNGAIITSLNLFSTKFDQVMNLVDKRAKETPNLPIFIDTPGQIEVFTWSASGAIITDMLAATYPTVLLFVVDTPRCSSPTTFMSNMLYACSIMYKTRLPLVVVFNKIDVASHETAVSWMEDFEAFQHALDEEKDDSYIHSLSRSLSIALDDFYSVIAKVGVSAYTGMGMDALFATIEAQKQDYKENYLTELEAARASRAAAEQADKEESLRRLAADIDGVVGSAKKTTVEREEGEGEGVKGDGASSGGVSESKS